MGWTAPAGMSGGPGGEGGAREPDGGGRANGPPAGIDPWGDPGRAGCPGRSPAKEEAHPGGGAVG